MANQSTFYFAWTVSGDSAFNGSHMREDELIFSFKLSQEEGQFAQLELEIVNPHIGLLAPGRPFWAWFSWSDGASVYPLFFGRVVGIPSDMFADVITITLVAKPKDYIEQRLALAASLRVPPFYDPIFIDEGQRENPDTVLEGYSALWHSDRVTHQVTISDVIAGEEGVVEFTPNDVFYDNVSVEITEAPAMVCEIDASVSWVQCDHTGKIEFRKESLKSLSSAVADDLPAPGTDLGGGFKANKSQNSSGGGRGGGGSRPGTFEFNWTYKNGNDEHNNGDSLSANVHYTISTSASGLELKPGEAVGKALNGTSEDTSDFSYHVQHGDPMSGTAAEMSVNRSRTASSSVDFEIIDTNAAAANTDIEIGTEVEQDRKETIHVRVLADLQPVLSEATETDDNIKEKLSMQASDVVKEGAATPSDGVYFPTARGLQSLEYLLMVARAHLLVRSRVIKTSWDCKFGQIVNINCRKNASIEDSRLPGGIALGKVVSYEMTGTGDNGEFVGHVSIASAVGYGNAVTLADGTPDYVNVGYVDGYQHYTGRFIAAITNDMSFSPLSYVSVGIQLPISADQILVRYEWNNAFQLEAAQRAQRSGALTSGVGGGTGFVPSLPGSPTSGGGIPADLRAYALSRLGTMAEVDQAIRDNPAWLEIELKPIQGISTEVEYDADVNPLVIPMQINLSAASTP